MNSLLRFSLLGLCSLTGVGLAIALAASSDLGATADGGAPKSNEFSAEPKSESNLRSAQHSATDDASASLQSAQPAPAQLEPRPPIAHQAPAVNDDALQKVLNALGALNAQNSQPAIPKAPVPPAEIPAIPALPGAAQTPTPTSGATSVAQGAAADSAPVVEPRVKISRGQGEGDDRISLTIQGADIRGVLEMLSEQGDLNILASNNVTGTVSATLKDVNIETALDAILRSSGYEWQRDGRFIYVGTAADFATMLQADDQIGTRLYRLNYVKAADLQGLVAPLLTPEVGTVSISAPAEVGIAADNTAVGGDSFAGQEALLVRDYVSVLEQIDQVVAQIDRRPTQVAIEAMILSVKIDDKNSLGVDFELLRDRGHLRITSGSPLTDLASLNLDQGGFKLGFLDSSLGLFVNALESIGDTNVIATPRLMCLNKHRAQILIGSELGYVSTTQTETSTTQSVEFLEVGTQLRIRPFISSDGLIRMEVHPELSTGNVRVEGGFTLPDKELTEVTTNVVVRDGCTVILGGLMRDELSNSTRQIPYLGSMPLVGPLFRQTNEDTERREILILITPRIVYEPDTCVEGNDAASEFHFRHQVFADKMNPLGKRYLGRRYFRLAQNAWAAGRGRQALRLVNLAIHFDPQSRAAIDLRTDIWVGDPTGDHTIPVPFREVPPGSPIDGETVAPWLLERLQAAPGQGASHPLDAGRPGTRTDIIDPNQVR